MRQTLTGLGLTATALLLAVGLILGAYFITAHIAWVYFGIDFSPYEG